MQIVEGRQIGQGRWMMPAGPNQTPNQGFQIGTQKMQT
jgi:hypothetical protein